MFAPAMPARRSPVSVAFSAALHAVVLSAGIWAADLRAFEAPRPARRSVTFLAVVSRLPEITIADARPAADAPAPVAHTPAVAVAPAPEPTAAREAPPVHEPAARPLEAVRPEAAPIVAAIVPEPLPVESVTPSAALPPPPVAVGGFDRATNGRSSASGVVGVVVGAGLQSARAAAMPRGGSADAVRSAGFDVVTQPRAAPVAPVAAAPERLDVPVEIVFKPTPAYTDEAKALRVQGEVIVEVEFTAQREVRVLRVVRGLGHGLDESAVRAASQIRFTPAQSAGRPVDVRTIVHIVFQLS
jgi:TonB family protein